MRKKVSEEYKAARELGGRTAPRASAPCHPICEAATDEPCRSRLSMKWSECLLQALRRRRPRLSSPGRWYGAGDLVILAKKVVGLARKSTTGQAAVSWSEPCGESVNPRGGRGLRRKNFEQSPKRTTSASPGRVCASVSASPRHLASPPPRRFPFAARRFRGSSPLPNRWQGDLLHEGFHVLDVHQRR